MASLIADLFNRQFVNDLRCLGEVYDQCYTSEQCRLILFPFSAHVQNRRKPWPQNYQTTMAGAAPPNLQHLAAFQLEARAIFRKSSGESYDKDFRSLFGVGLQVCCQTYRLCEQSNNLPDRCEPKFFLWALMFLKLYDTESVLARMAKTTRKTYRKWVWPVLECIARLYPQVVSYSFVVFVTETLRRPTHCFLS